MSVAKKMSGTPEKYGLLLVRLAVGLVFVLHGYEKLFVSLGGSASLFAGWGLGKHATMAAYVASSVEFGCGILLVLGLFTRLAAVPVVAGMVLFIVQTRWPHALSGVAESHEYAVLLGAAALALLLSGPGAVAADNMRGKRK
jgi:putative oxidoreductase